MTVLIEVLESKPEEWEDKLFNEDWVNFFYECERSEQYIEFHKILKYVFSVPPTNENKK